jgi:hypothetical protein
MARALLAGLGLLVAVLVSPAAAAAELPAPQTTTMALRAVASQELRAIVAQLSTAERARVVGVYVAFDDDAAEVNAMAACDDDGDYVVVLTDAMLRLADLVSFGRAVDEETGAHKLEAYAELLAASQRAGARLLPPPAGFFDVAGDADPSSVRAVYEQRLRETLSAIIARELAHSVRGDLTCPHPTATKEPGDDVWTPSEQRAALELAPRLSNEARGLQREVDALRMAEAAGRTSEGYVAFLTFLAKAAPSPTSTTARLYTKTHGAPARRAEAVRSAKAPWL